MSTYIVLKHGVYIQEVYGPFSLEDALETAQTLAFEDDDGYHEWEVHLLTPQGIGPLVKSYRQEANPKFLNVGGKFRARV